MSQLWNVDMGFERAQTQCVSCKNEALLWMHCDMYAMEWNHPRVAAHTWVYVAVCYDCLWKWSPKL